MKKKINLKDIFDIKKVIALTKVFCKDYFSQLPINKSKDSKQSKIFKMCFIIAIIGIAYIAFYIINFLDRTTHPQIFLNAYLLIMAILTMFQQILVGSNIYYFSKDLEYIMPFPIKPIELLIARFNMLVSVSYSSMSLFLLIPLLIYGFMVTVPLSYYLGVIIVVLVFPIFFGLIISTIMLFVMQLSKLIKNKDVFQFIITFIMTSILTTFMIQAISTIFSNLDVIEQIDQGESINLLEIVNGKIENVNKYLLTINPCVKILTENNFLGNIFEVLKILFINILALIMFIIFGKVLYLKNILKNIQKVNIKKIKNTEIKYKNKKTNKNKAYIKNEFKQLIKTPAFFMQCIFPIILIVITLTAIVISLYPSLVAIMEDEEMGEFNFDISILITIIVILQLIFTFSNLSITAISRKGKNAFFIKYIPISLYKQFLYLNLPQIILNIFISLIILVAAKYLIPEISIIYLIIIFIIGLILNIINSFLMLVADLRKPNLEWDNETDAIKQNKNKLYQYVLSIVIVLILIYFSTIFEKINLNLAIIIILFILFIILFLINKIINNKINKLFNKII